MAVLDMWQVAWMRACRTDKGVHAAGQVVSLKILLKMDAVKQEGMAADDLEVAALRATADRLNELLPTDIRIFAIRRTANSFHAKEQCDSRFYEYLFPTFALARSSAEPYLNPVPRPFTDRQDSILSREAAKTQAKDSDDEAQMLESAEKTVEPISEMSGGGEEEDEGRAKRREYRIDGETMSKMRHFLKKYHGTHSFHNFTIGKSASDPSCKRHIFDITVIGLVFLLIF